MWWLLGFGDSVVVHEPVVLREELGEIAARMAATDQFSGTQSIYTGSFAQADVWRENRVACSDTGHCSLHNWYSCA